MFVCPAQNKLTDATPQLCRRYYTLQNAVAPITGPLWARAASHVEPYVRPTLDRIAPFYHQSSLVAGKYGVPAAKRLQSTYRASLEPRVAALQQRSHAEYEKRLAPHVDRSVSTVRDSYDAYVGRHLRPIQAQVAKFAEERLNPLLSQGNKYTKATRDHWHHVGKPKVAAAAAKGYQSYWDSVHPRLVQAVSYARTKHNEYIVPRARVWYASTLGPYASRFAERVFFYRANDQAARNIHDAISSDSVIAESTSVLGATRADGTAGYVVPDAGQVTPGQTPEPFEDAGYKAMEARVSMWVDRLEKAGQDAKPLLDDELKIVLTGSFVREDQLLESELYILEQTIKREIIALKDKVRKLAISPQRPTDISDAQAAVLTVANASGEAIVDMAERIRAHASRVADDARDEVSRRLDQIVQGIEDLRAEGDGHILKDYATLLGGAAFVPALRTAADEAIETLSAQRDGAVQSKIPRLEDLKTRYLQSVNRMASNAAKEISDIKRVSVHKVIQGDGSDDFGHGALHFLSSVASEAQTAILGTPTTETGFSPGETIAHAKEAVAQAAQGAQDYVDSHVNDMRDSVYEEVDHVKEAVAGSASHAQQAAHDAFSNAQEAAGSRVESAQTAMDHAKSYIADEASSVVSLVSEQVMPAKETPTSEQGYREYVESVAQAQVTENLKRIGVVQEAPADMRSRAAALAESLRSNLGSTMDLVVQQGFVEPAAQINSQLSDLRERVARDLHLDDLAQQLTGAIDSIQSNEAVAALVARADHARQAAGEAVTEAGASASAVTEASGARARELYASAESQLQSVKSEVANMVASLQALSREQLQRAENSAEYVRTQVESSYEALTEEGEHIKSSAGAAASQAAEYRDTVITGANEAIHSAQDVLSSVGDSGSRFVEEVNVRARAASDIVADKADDGKSYVDKLKKRMQQARISAQSDVAEKKQWVEAELASLRATAGANLYSQLSSAVFSEPTN